MIQASTVGRLGKDAEERTTPNGHTAVKFSIATKKGKDETQWVDCTMWGKRGQSLLPYLKKGGSVWVSGELTSRTFETNGVPKFYMDLNVQTLEFAGAKPKEETAPASTQDYQDIPF